MSNVQTLPTDVTRPEEMKAWKPGFTEKRPKHESKIACQLVRLLNIPREQRYLFHRLAGLFRLPPGVLRFDFTMPCLFTAVPRLCSGSPLEARHSSLREGRRPEVDIFLVSPSTCIVSEQREVNILIKNHKVVVHECVSMRNRDYARTCCRV